VDLAGDRAQDHGPAAHAQRPPAGAVEGGPEDGNRHVPGPPRGGAHSRSYRTGPQAQGVGRVAASAAGETVVEGMLLQPRVLRTGGLGAAEAHRLRQFVEGERLARRHPGDRQIARHRHVTSAVGAGLVTRVGGAARASSAVGQELDLPLQRRRAQQPHRSRTGDPRLLGEPPAEPAAVGGFVRPTETSRDRETHGVNLHRPIAGLSGPQAAVQAQLSGRNWAPSSAKTASLYPKAARASATRRSLPCWSRGRVSRALRYPALYGGILSIWANV